MKRKVMLFGLVLVLELLALGCGGKSALAGTWYRIEGSGSRIPEKVELLKDGSGFALDQAITWKTENKRLYITHPMLAMAFNYEASGNDLVLTNDERQEFVYTKKLGGDSKLTGTWFNIGGGPKFEFLKDGTGVVDNGMQFVWKTKDNTLFIAPPILPPGRTYEVSGSTLTLKDVNAPEHIIEFTRNPPEPGL